MIVKDHIKDFLEEYETPNMLLYPTVYIDDNDNWHENYWFLNFYKSLDCLDMVASQYDKEDDIYLDPDIEKFSLDETILNKIPEEQRLVFRIGRSLIAYIFMHLRVVEFLQKINASGVRFLKYLNLKKECNFVKIFFLTLIRNLHIDTDHLPHSHFILFYEKLWQI